nr:MAG TPA: hypothetical protein [Caudoviricetes sp.]
MRMVSMRRRISASVPACVLKAKAVVEICVVSPPVMVGSVERALRSFATARASMNTFWAEIVRSVATALERMMVAAVSLARLMNAISRVAGLMPSRVALEISWAAAAGLVWVWSSSMRESHLLGPAATRWSFWRGVSMGVVLSVVLMVGV